MAKSFDALVNRTTSKRTREHAARRANELLARLHKLLDRQDQGHKLTAAEKREAQGLVSVSELLSLLKMRSTRKAAPAHKSSR